MFSRKTLCALASLAAIGGIAAIPAMAQPPAPPAPFTLSSPAFADGAPMPVPFSQAAPGAAPGEGTSPPMVWANPPAGVKSFVFHMQDLDSAINRRTDTQVHWLVWNLPPTSTGLTQGQPRGATLPDGSSQTSATGLVYRGPGAPATTPPHHYIFEVYALDIDKIAVTPSDDEQQNRRDVFEAMQGHIMGKAVYTTTFRRPAATPAAAAGAPPPAAR